MATAWFVSDCHLKPRSEGNQEHYLTFLKFLRQLGTARRPATHLFLLGDIFDMWVGSSPFFYRVYQEYVDVLSEVQARHIQIVYLEGNHDIHVGDFWRRRGVEVHQKDVLWSINGKKVYLTHGDFINPHDRSYHRYVRFLRSRFAKRIINLLPGWFWYRLGSFLSQRSRQNSSVRFANDEPHLPRFFSDFARALYHKEKFDLLIAGHIHVWSKIELLPNIWAINLGTWLVEPGALCLTEQNFFWEAFDGVGPSAT